MLPIRVSGLHFNGNCNLDPVPVNVSVTDKSVIKKFLVILSNLILIKLLRTASFLIIDTALAGVPVVANPPDTSIIGALR